jgi:RNA polymerase sigma factor (sigma-70 family)
METDYQLLESYATRGCENAFRELVERHINLVYSAALRETRGNAGQAEDVAQAVFAELARRARELSRHPALAGWLYSCVRRMAANLRRAETRRYHRELEAGAFCDADGTFCVPDVPPGIYELEIKLPDVRPDSVRTPDQSGGAPIVASIIREVDVSKNSTGRGSEPLELGDLMLSPPPGTSISDR